MAERVPGIDISHWQGLFNFKAAAANGYKFCFAKATEGGSYIDKQFARNRTEAKKHGLLFGAYHFLRPQSDPVEQAEHFFNITKGVLPGELPAVLDWEVMDGARNSQGKAGALKWMSLIHEWTGVPPILYTGPSFVKERGGLAEFASYPLWLAHYTKTAPRVPPAWKTWSFWQYSDSAGLDKNWFNGSYDQLEKFVKPGDDTPRC